MVIMENQAGSHMKHDMGCGLEKEVYVGTHRETLPTLWSQNPCTIMV